MWFGIEVSLPQTYDKAVYDGAVSESRSVTCSEHRSGASSAEMSSRTGTSRSRMQREKTGMVLYSSVAKSGCESGDCSNVVIAISEGEDTMET
jgi:hypothetical protein